MKALLVMFALAMLLAAPERGSAGLAAQPLAIDLHGDGARATQLPQYDPDVAVAVSVRDTSGQVADSVTVDAVGPHGDSTQTQLTRTGSATFGATLSFSTQGSWRLIFTSRSGRTTTQTSPVWLDVAALPASNAWQIGLAVGSAMFLIIGGGGFVVLRRLLRATDNQRAPAA